MKFSLRFPKVPVVPVDAASKTGGKWIDYLRTKDPEIVPLLACDAIGVGLIGSTGVYQLCANPEVNLRRRRRETPTVNRLEKAEGEAYMAHRRGMATLVPNPINMHPSFEHTRS